MLSPFICKILVLIELSEPFILLNYFFCILNVTFFFKWPQNINCAAGPPSFKNNVKIVMVEFREIIGIIKKQIKQTPVKSLFEKLNEICFGIISNFRRKIIGLEPRNDEHYETSVVLENKMEIVVICFHMI